MILNVAGDKRNRQSAFLSAIQKDPLENLFSWGIWAYCVILVLLLAWPYKISYHQYVENNVHWLAPERGIEFNEQGLVVSENPAAVLHNKIVLNNAFALECWVRSLDKDQYGPARIVSYSIHAGQRNFTLGQEGGDLVFRLRTNSTDPNGMYPTVRARGTFDSDALRHIVVNFQSGNLWIFVDGKKITSSQYYDGTLANWDDSFYLMLGNEKLLGRPWKGQITYLCIYNRPMRNDEVQKSFSEGINGGKEYFQGAILRYLFTKQTTRRIKDVSENEITVDLVIPSKMKTTNEARLEMPIEELTLFQELRDLVNNLILFVPFGFFSFARSYRNTNRFLAVMISIGSGFLFSFVMESAQYFIPDRVSSMVDLLSNSIGTAMGVLFFVVYKQKLLKHNKTIVGFAIRHQQSRFT
jgi:VanZ family protein